MNSQINTELSRLLAQQTEYLKKSSPTPFEVEECKRAGERIRKLFAQLEQEKTA
jgi:hypothetical protein